MAKSSKAVKARKLTRQEQVDHLINNFTHQARTERWSAATIRKILGAGIVAHRVFSAHRKT